MQKRQRFVADQRLDLPQYNSMIGLISEEFHNFYREGVTSKNYVVNNWKIEDAGGLTVRVNNTLDSLLFNTEREGSEKLIYRAANDSLLELDLDDNATNYVEVEIVTTTTANDAVAIWDQSANGGSGEEFIQNVDTVYCECPKLISNTIAFSVGQPQRVRLATVITSGGSIVSVTDSREFLYHLANDWDFVDGGNRTDKTIQTIKNMYDALTTSIKEMKGSTTWYEDQGITTAGLLERMNYLLVDGGQISWNLPKSAKGHLISHKADPNFGIIDGDTLTIGDGVNTVTFNFDMNASAPANAITLPSSEEDELAVKTAIINAINASVLTITATSGTGSRIELSHDNVGIVGNVSITESMSNGASLYAFGMEGGFDNVELEWTSDLRIIAPSRAYEYTIDSQVVTNLAIGEVAYVTLPDFGTAPTGSLPVTKVSASSYPLDFSNTRNYIIAYRSGSKVYFGNGFSGVELEDGETTQLGDGITADWITATGLVDEYDSTPPYWSTHWITPSASFTDALSSHDQVIEDIYNMVVGAPYDERIVLGTAAPANSFFTLPPHSGYGSSQNYQTGINQIEVYFNGRRGKLGADWNESANIGAGVGNQIEILEDLPKDMAIDIRIQIGGGQDGTVSSDSPAVLYEGSTLTGAVSSINFRDECEVSTVGADVEVRVRRPKMIGRRCVNNTASAIPIGKAVAWEDDGSIILADANDMDASDFVGITAEEIPPSGGVGFVAREGYIPDVTAGLDAGSDPTPGSIIYLSETAGEITLAYPTGIMDTVLKLGRAEPPEGVAGNATSLWLHPEVIAEV